MGNAYVWGTSTAEVLASAAAVQATLTLPCVVPRTLGKTLPQARDSFRKAGCQIGSIVHEISGKVKKYHVKAQALKAGLTVPNGTKVTVTLSDGPRKPPVKKKAST
jgi:beta-lactam-binding protein with PASTA domain